MHQTQLLLPTLLGLALTTSSLAVRAENNDDMSFPGMFKMDRIDKNKDNMVSKAEFLEMMGKAYDMKAKEMNVKGGKMKMEDYMALSAFLSRGEKNK